MIPSAQTHIFNVCQCDVAGSPDCPGYVRGAPFQVHDRVKIVRRCDDACAEQYLGKTGVVVELKGDVCGSQLPHDPWIRVQLDDEIEGVPRRNGFGKQELEKVLG